MELKRVSDTTVKLDIKTGSHDGDSKTGYPVTSTSASTNVKEVLDKINFIDHIGEENYKDSKNSILSIIHK